MELTPTQIRVLGCLVEKEATTPEHYPLSSNALVQACNQKNNRDPLTSCTEREIDAVLLELRQLGLVRTVHAANARVPKHRHVLDEAWGLTRGQLAVLAVLMLRGPNTANELTTRTERYSAPGDHDRVRAALDQLAALDPPMVVELPRQAGQRETRFTHRRLDAEAPAVDAPHEADRPMPIREAPERDGDEVAALRAELDDLRARFDDLCARLGETI
jgi:uncharacterized protein YceH (UPF0502 family)